MRQGEVKNPLRSYPTPLAPLQSTPESRARRPGPGSAPESYEAGSKRPHSRAKTQTTQMTQRIGACPRRGRRERGSARGPEDSGSPPPVILWRRRRMHKSLMPVRPTKAATGRPSENPAGPSSQEYETPGARGSDYVWAASDPWQLWVCQNPIGRAAEAEPRPAPAHVDTPQRDRRSVGLYRPTRYLRRAQRHIPAHSLHAKLKKPSRKAPPAQGPVAATRWTPGEGRGRRKRAPSAEKGPKCT